MRVFAWTTSILLATLAAGCGSGRDADSESPLPGALGIDTRGGMIHSDPVAAPAAPRNSAPPRIGASPAAERQHQPVTPGLQSAAEPARGVPTAGTPPQAGDPNLPRLGADPAPDAAPSSRLASKPFVAKTTRSPKPRRDVKPRETLRKTTKDVYELNAENTEGTVKPEREIKGSDPITISGNAYVNMVGRIAIGQMEHALNLYNGVNGRYPKDYAEFKKEIIDANQIRLPTLPYYQEYFFDVENHKLVVREFPDRKKKQYERRRSNQ